MKSQIWTDAQFEEMSWHDNHVHGLRIVETGKGEGDLVLDVDHIVEWLDCEGAGFNFRIVPVNLTFHGVMFPRISLDYAASTVAFGPFMIHSIERHIEQRTHYVESSSTRRCTGVVTSMRGRATAPTAWAMSAG